MSSPIQSLVSGSSTSGNTGDIFSTTVKATNDLFQTMGAIATADEKELVTMPDGRVIDLSTTTGYVIYSACTSLFYKPVILQSLNAVKYEKNIGSDVRSVGLLAVLIHLRLSVSKIIKTIWKIKRCAFNQTKE